MVPPVTPEPTKVFISYASEDWELATELRTHLLATGKFSVWDDRTVRAGEDFTVVRRKHLTEANLVLILVSASLLASHRGHQDIHDAVERTLAATGVRVCPILARACHWQDTELERLSMWPRDLRPVAASSKVERDEIWTELVGELVATVRFAAKHITPQTATKPGEERDIGDIFRTGGLPEITFVEPAQLFRLRAYLRVMGQGLVIEGPSGVGKTTLVTKVLADRQDVRSEWLLGQSEADRKKLDERLINGFKGHLIIDDFHRLDRPRQIQVADAMKLIADRDARDAKITVIGINPVGESLITALAELAGRFEILSMGRQPDEKISELIQKGEAAANIVFRRRDEFVVMAAGSFFTAQQLCYEAALTAGIDRTAPTLTPVDVGFLDVIDAVLRKLDSKYFAALRSFACHDDVVPPRGACLALLWLLRRSPEGHASLDDVHFQFEDGEVRDALTLLKSSYLARCFEANPELRSLFFYNKQAGILSIEDPRLKFYLLNMSWPSFIERTGTDALASTPRGTSPSRPLQVAR
jgi:hypothetical protein